MKQHNNISSIIERSLRTAFLTLLFLVVGVGSAWADTWDGTTKYTTIADASIEGAGTEGSPYIIDDANKFVAFGMLANNSTAYWKLTVDIDLGGNEWPYAGAAPKTFKGHLDGGGHTVSNYTITPITKTANGLFGTITGSSATNRAEIKDLKIDNVIISTTEDLEKTTYIGALVGNASQYVDFKNVQIVDADNNGKTVNITLDNLVGDCNIGGLAGAFQKNSTMENCTVNKSVVLVKGEGTTIAGTCYIGGAIGYCTGSNATDVTKIDKPTPGSTNGLTVNNPSVTVHKILSSWYISTAIGRINNYSDVNYVTVSNPTLIYKAVGSPNNGLYLGTLTGNIQGNGGSATATPVSTPVKNINITGTSQITIGTGTEEIKNVRAGVVGLINTNADIATWDVATSNITVNGSLTTSTNYFGGVIGHVTSNKSAASTDTQTAIDGVTLGSSTITITGNVVKESYIGSIFGRIEGHNGDASNKPKRTVVTNVTTTGTTKVVFGSSSSNVSIANVRAGAIGSVAVNSNVSGCTIADMRIEVNGILETGSSYLAGGIGQVQSSATGFPDMAANSIGTTIDDLTVKKSDIKITEDVLIKDSYIGGVFGRIDGTAGDASKTQSSQRTSVTNLKTTGTTSITIGTKSSNTINSVQTGGVAGYVTNNVNIADWTIANTNIQVNGSFATSVSYIGGIFGHVASAAPSYDENLATTVKGVSLAGSTVNIASNVEKESYIGSLFGCIEGTTGDATKQPQQQPQRTLVQDITTTGTTQVTFGTDQNKVDVAAVKTGAVGYAIKNSQLNNWTIADTRVKVNGNLTTSTSYLGGIVGHTTSATSAYPGVLEGAIATKVHDITVKKSDVNVTGNVGVASYVGGGFGYIVGVTSTTVKPQPTEVTGIKFKSTDTGTGNKIGIAKVTIGTNNTNTINYVRTGVAGMATTNVIIDDWEIENSDIRINGKFQTTASSIGGFIGIMSSADNAPVKVTNMDLTTSCIIAINGDVDTKEIYVGGAFGRMDSDKQTRNQPVTATNINVTGLNMSFGGDFAQPVYAGGIVGYLYSMNKDNSQPTSVVNCSVGGQIRSSASKTFLQDKTYAFGGVVGYNNQNATTNQSIIKQCISEVDFNLSGYTPASVSGSSYNLYKQGFVIGGVIGRIDTPSLLPEHLYYSGKIYAPFAVVGPIVGTFQKSLGSAAYVYEDYSGEYAAPTLTSEEWKKADSWYYVDYKIGLSDAVLTQTARTRNYNTELEVDNGISYLPVDEATFIVSNEISNVAKCSQTVLAYNVNNNNTDGGIYPQWSTNENTYPAYYMYYMQGVNRGLCKKNTETGLLKTLIDKEITFMPILTRSGDINSGYVYAVDPGEIASDPSFTIAYQWYQSDKTTPLTGETSKTLNKTDEEVKNAGGVVYCKVTISGDGFTPVSVYLLGFGGNVVFIDGTNGIDNVGDSRERGWTDITPVKTINHANSLLLSPEEGGSWDRNIIVVMGTMNSDADFRSDGKNPVTLTGKWGGKDYKGLIKIKQINQSGGENTLNLIGQSGQKGSNCYVQSDTKFEYLTFQANSNSDGNNFIECHGNNVWFGKGLSMTGFRNLGEDHGNLDMAQNIPELSIILTATNLNEATIQRYTNREKPQVVTFESGHYGRILGGRYTNKFFASADNTSHTILGSPEHPIWAIVDVNIDKGNPNKGTINRHEGLNTGTVTNAFTCDINCIVAGLTDGSMYGDYTINVHGGKIGYIVGGNQGNPVPNGSKTFTQPGGKSGNWGQWPNATYLGRTVINVEQDPELKDIVIDNLYAGGLGRKANGDAATSVVDMYMYGHTEINMKSGTVTGNVYGGGAGGVIGINPWDMHVPYATTETENSTNAIMNGVQYGEWGAKKAGSPLVNVTLHDSDGNGGYTTKQLNLDESYTTLNISGGTINGSVYGGGCGYVSNMPEQVVVQGVGSVFGTSNVNISGGTIHGSVYGGSEGSDKYYGAVNKYDQTINHIAEMNGTVNLTITGTDSQYPTIDGNIYGAGMGIESGYNETTKKDEEYLRIATAGNAELGGTNPDTYKTDINILIDLPESHPFNGNIYGGGEKGAVDGTTKVVIKGGTIEGDVFGGGKGEEGHPNKAKVTGKTKVIVDKNYTEPTP